MTHRRFWQQAKCLFLYSIGRALKHFIEKRISDPEIRALMGKIKVKGVLELNSLSSEKFPAEVEVTTENGRKFLEGEYYPKGSFKNSLSGKSLDPNF
jgi:2-methylcitrate dehydratase PrpD